MQAREAADGLAVHCVQLPRLLDEGELEHLVAGLALDAGHHLYLQSDTTGFFATC